MAPGRGLSNSLRVRIQSGLLVGLLAASLLLLWIGGMALREVGEAVMLARLQHDAQSLLSAMTPGENGWRADDARLTAVYRQPFSGHYWQVTVAGQQQSLRSRSLWDQSLPIPGLQPGQHWEGYLPGPRDQRLVVSATGYRKQGRDLTLAVAEDMNPVERLIGRFQGWSALALGLLALALMGLQYGLLRLSFRSLGELRGQLDELRQGRRERLDESLPIEVSPLAAEVNRLLLHMQQQLQHSRNALGNLAHALKAPLALLVQDLERRPRAESETALRQARRLRDLVQRELRRARMATAGRPARAFDPRRDGADLIDSLRRLHAARALVVELSVSGPESVPFDAEDMLELLGNLLDNACKWAQQQVRCRIDWDGDLRIRVSDDGQGVSADLLQRLAGRGVRLDEDVEGSGLGLAIVADLVRHYGGRLDFARDAELGGLAVGVDLPSPPRP